MEEEKYSLLDDDHDDLPIKTGGGGDGVISISPHAVTDLYPARKPTIATPQPSRESVLRRLSEALLGKTLTKVRKVLAIAFGCGLWPFSYTTSSSFFSFSPTSQIDLSQRGLLPSDARLVKMALLQNQHLSVLQLGYNMLGDVGTAVLAPAIGQLESLDLGFNSIGDLGCVAIAEARPLRLQNLYLAGNKIGQEGATALAHQMILGGGGETSRCRLRSLYLTGNHIGSEGVEAIARAVVESEAHRNVGTMQELYLGAGMVGCMAVAPLLQGSSRMKILSLPNCEIKDDSLGLLCNSLESNSFRLPLESLQLSFNRITCTGIESLVHALVSGGTCSLRELLLDNNEIADHGIRHMSNNLIPYAVLLDTLDVGFNRIETSGIKLLTKTLREHGVVKKLSISGNAIDTVPAAKAISFYLACSPLVESIALDRCFSSIDMKRHIAAGVVSNPGTALKYFSGFDLAQIVTTLGFPRDMNPWSNRQVLDFIHIMWNNQCSVSGEELTHGLVEEEKLDPIHCLPTARPRTAPIEATAVIEAAKKTFSTIAANGLDVFTNQSVRSTDGSPIVSYTCMIECKGDSVGDSPSSSPSISSSLSKPPNKVASFVAPPAEECVPSEEESCRRRRWLKGWLGDNAKLLEKLGEQKFNANELWRLHQHYFTPVVNVSGGETPINAGALSSTNVAGDSTDSVTVAAAGSQPVMTTSKSKPTGAIPSQAQGSSLPMLKRKVSYSCLAAVAANPHVAARPSLEIPTMPTKRARRNRTRISFMPRIQAKLNSYLDVSHEKALILMRQLQYCEQTWGVTHLSGPLAHDAETILLELL